MTSRFSLRISAALALALSAAAASAQVSTAEERTSMQSAAAVEAIDRTWSGHRVDQVLVVRPGHHIVAYYDANRQLTIAHRDAGATSFAPWRFHKVDTWIGWDSHNKPAIGIDEQGHIHVMANMHVDQMVYFRSEKPWDVRSLKGYDHLVNPQEEARVTYPEFFNDANGALIAKYRVGASGNGFEIYNRYDVATKRWARLHDGPFVDGEGERNGYFVGPAQGPDGFFHLIWVWRETPNADTNHDLSYARSRDLINWETSDGKPLKLPIRLRDAEIVDATQPGGGLLNGQSRLGFDNQKRPMISYYKRDKAGDHQIFIVTKRDGRWQSSQITNWKGLKLDFSRTGSLAIPLAMAGNPVVAPDGSIRVRVVKQGDPIEITVDSRTLKPLGEAAFDRFPASVIRNDLPPGTAQYVAEATDDKGTGWYLSWYAYPSNQDRARADIPPAATLLLHSVPGAAARGRSPGAE